MNDDQMPSRDAWWRHAVVYQIYPRSFADANGDGTGDIAGMISRLDYVAGLGVDAVWVSPWYRSPLADGGYDVADYRAINPEFGTLADADAFVAGAHERGLRVLIDLVPNHCSEQHPWFQAAIASPDAPERDLFVIRPGQGGGESPPNNWASVFGGPAWHRLPDGEWYLHTFAPEQPDWNWANPAVADEFDSILRFWFDRGVDGFRIDVADSVALDPTLPDVPVDPGTGLGTLAKFPGAPRWDQPALEQIHRRWRRVADEYQHTPQGPRVFVSEAYLDATRLVRFVEPGRLHTTFNFDMLQTEWSADSMRHMITRTLELHDSVGAPCTWVLGNHDQMRVVSRYGKRRTGNVYGTDGPAPEQRVEMQQFIGTPTDLDLGRRRARAAALLELALPGGAYVYQGDELGLPEFEALPDELRQDPTWERSGHRDRGRDGCRIPIPWQPDGPSLGFGAGPGWLPQPDGWGELSVAAEAADPGSFLTLYRAALAQRRRNPDLTDPRFAWIDAPAGVLAFRRGEHLQCWVSFGPEPVALPPGEVRVASAPLPDGVLPPDTAAWLVPSG